MPLNDQEAARIEEIRSRNLPGCTGFLLSMLDRLAAERPEVVRAYWHNDVQFGLDCSNCGAPAPVDCEGGERYESKFCPNCGATMGARMDAGKRAATDIDVPSKSNPVHVEGPWPDSRRYETPITYEMHRAEQAEMDAGKPKEES